MNKLKGKKLNIVIDKVSSDTVNTNGKIKGSKIIKRKAPINKIDLSDVKPVLVTTQAGIVQKTETYKRKTTSESTTKEKDKKEKFIYDDGGNKTPASIFFLIILVLGFYVMYDQFFKVNNEPDPELPKTIQIKKIETRPFVYFENKEIVIEYENEDITSEYDIVININTTEMENLETKLNNERKLYKTKYEYVAKGPQTKSCYVSTSKYNTDTKYLAKFVNRSYNLYEVNKYIIVEVINNVITLCSSDKKAAIYNYIIDTETGKIVYEDVIYNAFGTTKQDLINNIATTEEEKTQMENATSYTLIIQNSHLGIEYVYNGEIYTKVSTLSIK